VPSKRRYGWVAVGYQVSRINLLARMVVFVRIGVYARAVIASGTHG